MTQPAPGPHDTVVATPPLEVGAVRRTTTVDTGRPDGWDAPVVLDVRGRDVRRRPDGDHEVIDELALSLTVEPDSTITRVEAAGVVGLPDLEGLLLFMGWGRAMAERLPAERTLLASALEDLGGAYLVSGYAPLRAGRIELDEETAVLAADRQRDICSGWRTGGSMLTVLETEGVNAVPYGPATSPDLIDDGWHDVAPLGGHTVRRARRLDVSPTPLGLRADAHFRDSYQPSDGPEMALHEYTVRADVDRAGALAEVDVTPQVLPWAECPAAVASAQRVVGTPVADLAAAARRDLRGNTTCTHLTSTMRSLADVAHLSAMLSR